MSTNISVVPVGVKKCKPFLLEVMVFAPESGYKFQVSVEKSCTPTADPLWKLVFDLYKRNSDGFDQIVHVSYKADNPTEAKAIEATAIEGMTEKQAELLINKVHPAVKEVENANNLSAAELEAKKAKIKKAMSKVANAVAVEV
ncbi:MAG: hypothetical protein H0T92_05315 [Pyrinomonadaceae bacterium]|nr:hypothetical protein [Pyrinomonadaceae bacterium]